MTTLEGQMLGRYQLSERIGRGGMADVYRGYQPNLERAVAVKVLHPHLLEDPSFAERFRREAKSVAALHHPNIIQVIDFDTQGDYLFMVMEFVEGGHTLKKRLRELADLGQRIPLPQTLGLVAQIADALDYAHRQGMIHRDVKPANILLPTLERPLLSDFGIARIVGARGLTADGMTIGTPTYMSPEQSRAEPATERSDIYALGVVLFEMITGQPPYEGTPYDILKAHQHEPTPSPRRLAPMLPDEVEQIVLTCLAKDPAERYQRAGDLRDALRKASDGLRRAYEALDQRTAQDEPTEGLHALAAAPVAAPRIVTAEEDTGGTVPVEGPPPTTIPPTKVKRRPKVWVWAGLGGLALLAFIAVILLTGLYSFINEDARVNWLAEQAERAEEREEYHRAADLYEQAYDVKEDSYWLLEKAALDAMLDGDTYRGIDLLSVAIDGSGQDPYFVARRGYLYYRAGEYEAARADVERALSVNPEEWFAVYVTGLVLTDTGSPAEGKDVLLSLEGFSPDEYAYPFLYPALGHELHYDIARAAYFAGATDFALDYLDRSLEADSWWPEPYLLRADIYVGQGELESAREDLATALRIAEDMGRGEQADVIREKLEGLGVE